MERSDRYTGWATISMGFVARQAWVSNVTQSFCTKLVEHCVISLFLPGVRLDSITCMHPNRATHGSKAEMTDPSVANSELPMCGRGFSVEFVVCILLL